jgi:hypothetical protein
MDWKDIAKDVAKVAPALGGVLGGPAGAGLGGLIAAALGCGQTPSEVQQALLTNPDAAVKLKEIEAQVQLAQISAASAQVIAVNQTLQADARGDTYWQKSHHAFESTFALLIVASIYILLPVLKIPVPLVDPMVWMMIGGILGVTAWQHGEVNKKIADQA